MKKTSANSAAWPSADIMIAAKYPARDGSGLPLWSWRATPGFVSARVSAARRHFRHHPDVLDSGGLDRRHGANHFAVGDLLVGAHEDLAVRTLLRNRLQLGGQFVGVKFRVIEINLIVAGDRNYELFFLARQC